MSPDSRAASRAGTSHGSRGRIDLRAAAGRLGVHYMTAYRYVRLGRLPATREAGRWWVDPVDVQNLLTGQDVATTGRKFSPARYLPRLRRRLLAGDEPAVWQLIETALAAGATPRQALLDLLAPVMRDIGAECGQTLSVLDEHRATMVALRATCRLGPGFARRGRHRGVVILAGVAGDSHVLPVAIVATVLRGEGFEVAELGADTPAESIVAEVDRRGERLLAVGLSVSTDRGHKVARRTIAKVRTALAGRPNVAIIVGGPAIPDRDVAVRLGADDWASDAGGVTALLSNEEDRGSTSD